MIHLVVVLHSLPIYLVADVATFNGIPKRVLQLRILKIMFKKEISLNITNLLVTFDSHSQLFAALGL
jgi:hypothetical protein